MRARQVVRRADELEALAPAWRRLVGRSPGASIFQTPDWCLEWYRTFGAGPLHVFITADHGEIDGVGPFFLRKSETDSSSTLALIGTGNSDRLDLICEDALVGRELSQRVLAGSARARWAIDWRRVPGGSPLLASPEPGSIGEDTPCPGLALPRAYADLERSAAPHLQRHLQESRQRLGRRGAVRVETLRGDAIDAGLDDLFRLHAERWRLKGETGVLGDTRVQAFHRRTARRLDAHGYLRLIRITVERSTAAVYYGFQAFGRAWFYITGFDPALSSASPGTYLLAEVLRMAIEDGLSQFDFLSGREAYKYAWGATDEPFFWRRNSGCTGSIATEDTGRRDILPGGGSPG